MQIQYKHVSTLLSVVLELRHVFVVERLYLLSAI